MKSIQWISIVALCCLTFTGCKLTHNCTTQKYKNVKNAKGKFVKHGKQWRCYRGRKYFEGTYDKGTKVGIFNEWYELSLPYPIESSPVTNTVSYRVFTPKSQKVYAKGLLHGKALEWYRGGRVKSETHFVKGKPHGKATVWSQEGETVEEKFYERGVMTKVILHHKQVLSRTGSGNFVFSVVDRQKSVGTFPHKWSFSYPRGMTVKIDKLWKFTRYNAQGKVIARYHQSSAGDKYGIVRTWYPNGSKKAETTFYQNMLHGKHTEWHPNGKKKKEEVYFYAYLASQALWCSNGGKVSQGRFKGQKKHRKWTLWDSKGATSVTYYNKGKPCRPRIKGKPLSTQPSQIRFCPFKSEN